MTTPEPAELKPCPFCGSTPIHKLDHTTAKEHLIYCRCGCEIGAFLHGDKYIEVWNTRTPPAAPQSRDTAPDVDAIEALAKVGGTWFAPRNTKMAAEAIIRNLSYHGYTLRRETMTEAELEREAENLSVISRTNGVTLLMIKNMFVELAKKFRG